MIDDICHLRQLIDLPIHINCFLIHKLFNYYSSHLWCCRISNYRNKLSTIWSKLISYDQISHLLWHISFVKLFLSTSGYAQLLPFLSAPQQRGVQPTMDSYILPHIAAQGMWSPKNKHQHDQNCHMGLALSRILRITVETITWQEGIQTLILYEITPLIFIPSD